MGALFSALFEKFAAVLKWIADLWEAIFKAIWDVLKDGASWVFDQVLQVAVSAIAAIDVSALPAAGVWGTIPGEILNILGLLGVGTAITIITTAITIRLVLQLIPFTRLGS